jgi:hypothetical protein
MLGIEPPCRSPPTASTCCPLVAGTRCVARIQRLPAARIGEGAGVRVMESPFDAALPEALWWHPAHTHDAGQLWLRETAVAVGAQIMS